MLDQVHIRRLGVIEEVDLDLETGLTVLTGETGAGKTMVVTALELLVGARSDSTLVRSGADEGLVEARVAPVPETAGEWTDPDGADMVLAREVLASGGSRARIDGRLAPIGALGEVLGELVEVHAQHDQVRLGRPAVQRELLDRFAGEPHARTLDRYRETYTAWQDAVQRLESLAEDARERAREIDRLEHEIGEIEAVAPDPDGDGTLGARLSRLEHAEELRQAVGTAAAALGSEGAGEPVGVAVTALRRLGVEDPELDALRSRLADLTELLTDLAADLRHYGESVDVDARTLEEVRERHRVIVDLTRKYGEDVDAVLEYAGEARERLERLRGEEVTAGELEGEVAELADEVARQADEVSQGRRVAADQLEDRVVGHLADLGLEHARFGIEVEERDEPGPHGRDTVRFLLAANPGEPAVPLGQGASGGERSRTALAIEVALADVQDTAILVFDEVDAGVGGATAMAVGEKLAQLAAPAADGTRRQVLCVTHLAQLAAFADVHYVVEKGITGGRTVTTVRRVGEDARPAELARMLGGDAARDVGIAHAAELLAEAETRRAS